MASVDYEVVLPALGQDRPPGTQQIKWPRTGQTFGATDVGTPYITGSYTSISIHVYASSFAGGATVNIEGTNELAPTQYSTLHDPLGNALAITGSELIQVLEHPMQFRPRISVAAPDSGSLFIIANLSTQARK